MNEHIGNNFDEFLKEENIDITLMKVLKRIKDKYYPNSKTYFDENLKKLEEEYKSEVQG